MAASLAVLQRAMSSNDPGDQMSDEDMWRLIDAQPDYEPDAND